MTASTATTSSGQAHGHVVQRLVGLDPATSILVAEAIRLGIDDAALDVPEPVVAREALAGYNAGVRQLARGRFA